MAWSSGAGRFVIRYTADTAGVLDAYDILSAHLVGVSAGGAFAQMLALEFPDRVRSLVLISTTPATPGDRELPSPADEFRRFISTATVDWSDRESVVGYLVGYCRMLSESERSFDEAYARSRRPRRRTRT